MLIVKIWRFGRAHFLPVPNEISVVADEYTVRGENDGSIIYRPLRRETAPTYRSPARRRDRPKALVAALLNR